MALGAEILGTEILGGAKQNLSIQRDYYFPYQVVANTLTAQFDLEFGVNREDQFSFGFSYDIPNFFIKTINLPYTVSYYVLKEEKFSYDVSSQFTRNFLFPYHSAGTLLKFTDIPYNIKNQLTVDYAISYGIYNGFTYNFSFSYDIHKRLFVVDKYMKKIPSVIKLKKEY